MITIFDTVKFGRYLSKLRKQADMTQSELADKLNLTRQAISHYELGDSCPDVGIFVQIAGIFGVTADELIASGEPTASESSILSGVALGEETKADSISDLISIAPFLKPSILEKLAKPLAEKGIDISNIIAFAEYLSDDSVLEMLKKADFNTIDDKLMAKLIPMLDDSSKSRIFAMIIDGEMDWHMIRVLIPYMEYMSSQVEAAVVEGYLPWEALEVLQEAMSEAQERKEASAF